jgi:tetratricopeptide (TPR) repeat protein
MAEAEAAMASSSHPRDALTWATMRALLDGRQDAVRRGVDELRRLAERTDDAEAWDRYWLQRFWAAFEWGTDEERFEVLDHCRERAYRFDEVPWWGNLTLLLAAMGKQDEAIRAFDAALQLPDAQGLDPLTNLIDAGALLGDAGRVALAFRSLGAPEGRLVVVGPGVVCKGSVDRYRALGLASLGRWDEAGHAFRSAEAAHRAIGARPLLERTIRQASGSLVAA